MGKYYAVKIGRKPGIYNTWDECKEQVVCFSGAIYKSFGRKEDALEFIDGEKKILTKNIAYTDGSFKEDKYYGCGVVMFIDGKKITHSFKGDDEDMLSMRNIGGELMAAMYVMQYCADNGIKNITLHHDYVGIECWALNKWKAEKEGAKRYKKFYDDIKDKVNVEFIWIKGHSNNSHNDEADRLASLALD